MTLPTNPIVLIPARLASTRLPNKPLAEIHGEPMIIHVWRRAMEAKIGRVVVAAAEIEIVDAIKTAGGEAVITRADHASGSDRIFEALSSLDPTREHDAIVNVQGDLPTVDVASIRAAFAPLTDPTVDIATIAAVITELAERNNPNVVKVVAGFDADDTDSAGELSIARALYFTRATAPSGDGPLYHHIGLYAYRRAALERFVGYPPSPLERREKLEQLRALEAGMRIDVALVDTVPLGVDTPADLARARVMLAPAD